MKKFLVFLLLIATFCLTACGNENNDKNNSKNTNVADKPPVGGITTSTVATTEDPYNGWTWLLGNVYIPNLPFTDWAGQNQDNISCYTIFIKSKDSAAFHAYAQSLTDFGYTIEQTESYSYKGTDPENRSIYLTDHENGQMQIAIYY